MLKNLLIAALSLAVVGMAVYIARLPATVPATQPMQSSTVTGGTTGLPETKPGSSQSQVSDAVSAAGQEQGAVATSEPVTAVDEANKVPADETPFRRYVPPPPVAKVPAQPLADDVRMQLMQRHQQVAEQAKPLIQAYEDHRFDPQGRAGIEAQMQNLSDEFKRTALQLAKDDLARQAQAEAAGTR